MFALHAHINTFSLETLNEQGAEMVIAHATDETRGAESPGKARDVRTATAAGVKDFRSGIGAMPQRFSQPDDNVFNEVADDSEHERLAASG
ncbi:hypothetical protein GCM10007394_12880 [Salinibacterium amurskyense]|nr:hypothetical protein GCM10007394_12880 [Salinibacterium amurskyense]